MTSPDRMKLENEKRVLRVVHEHPGIYRKLIAVETDLSSQTVTNLVTELIHRKILLEHSLSPGIRGRNPVSLTLNYGGFYIITAEVTIEKVDVYLHTAAEVVSVDETPLEGNEDVLQCLREAIARVGKKAESFERVQALVISVTGVVNENTGTVVEAEKLHWYQVNLAEEFSYLKLPVFVRNDVNLPACYEKAYCQDDMNFMVAKIDIGIGSSFVLGSRALKSANSVAGELGHVTIYSDEVRPCICGKDNCLTKFISTEGLEQTYGRPYSELVRDVKAGVTEAIGLVEQICDYLAPVLANQIISWIWTESFCADVR